MTLQHGKFYITKEQLLSYLGLPEGTHIEVKDEENDIDIYVISDKENQYLTEKKSSNENLWRIGIPLTRYTPSIKTKYRIINTSETLECHAIMTDISDKEAIKYVKDNLTGVILVKEEVLYYEKNK